MSTSQATKRKQNVLHLDFMICSLGLHRKRFSPTNLRQYFYAHRIHTFFFNKKLNSNYGKKNLRHN